MTHGFHHVVSPTAPTAIIAFSIRQSLEFHSRMRLVCVRYFKKQRKSCAPKFAHLAECLGVTIRFHSKSFSAEKRMKQNPLIFSLSLTCALAAFSALDAGRDGAELPKLGN